MTKPLVKGLIKMGCFQEEKGEGRGKEKEEKKRKKK